MTVLFVASEIFDNDDGSKGVLTYAIAASLAVAAYVLVEWVRRDPTRH